MSNVVDAILRLTIDSSAAKQGADNFTQATNAAKASAVGVTGATAQVTAAMKTAADSSAQVVAAMKSATQAQSDLQGAAKNTSSAFSLFGGATNDVNVRMREAQSVTRGLFASMAAGIPITQALAYELPNLARAVGLTELALNPLVLGAIAIVGALALLINSVVNTQNAFAQIQTSLNLTGRAAELNSASIKGMVDTMATLPGVSQTVAQQVIQIFANDRALGGAQFKQAAAIIGDYAKAVGEDLPTAANDLVKGLKDPTTFATELNNKFGILTLTQYEQIKAFQDQGDSAAAFGIILTQLQPKVEGLATKGLTPFKAAIHDLGNAWNETTSSLSSGVWADLLLGAVTKAVRGLTELTRLPAQIGTAFALLPLVMAKLANPSSAFDPSTISRTFGVPLQGGSNIATSAGEVQGPNLPQSVQQAKLIPPEQVQAVLDKYDQLDAKQLVVSNDLAKLNALYNAGVISLAQYAQATDKASAELAAIKTPVQLAQEQLANDAAASSVAANQREIYKAKIDAVTAALNNAVPAQQANALGSIAQQEAVLKLSTAYSDHLQDLKVQTDAANKLATANLSGAAAVVQQTAVNQALAEKTKNVEVNVTQLTQAYQALANAQQEASFNKQLQAQELSTDMAAKELSLVGQTSEQRSKTITLLQTQAQLQRDFPNITDQEKQHLLGLVSAQVEMNQEAAKLNGIFDGAANSLETSLVDALDGTTQKFSDFGTQVIQLMKKVAAQVALLLVFQPIVGSVGNLLGLSNGQGGTALTSGGASGGSGSSLLGIGSNLSSLGNSIFGGTGGITSALNSFGAANLGFADVGPSFVGPLLPTQTAGLTLGGFAGGIGAGFAAGGLLNSLAGGNALGGTVGSGLGSVAGALAGTFLFPGVGTLLGGLIGGGAGGLLGGLFGNNHPSVGPDGGTIITINNGQLGVGGSGADNGADPKVTENLANQVVPALNAILTQYGVTAKNLDGITTGTASRFAIYQGSDNAVGSGFLNAPRSGDDLVQFLLHYGLLQGTTATQNQVLNSGKILGGQDLSDALGLAQLIDTAGKAADKLDSVQQSFKDLGTQADAYVASAQKFGISQQQVFGALASDFNTSISDAITSITDPFTGAMDQLKKDEQARLDYATKIGGDITKVTQLDLLEQEQLTKQYAQTTITALQKDAADLKQWLQNEVVGANSSKTPAEQLAAAQGNLADAIQTAITAGANADLSKVTGAADTVLSIGKNTLGGATTGYSTLEQMTLSLVSNLGKQLNLPGFAIGGDFTVGGSGGTDSQVVAFRATPGEKVSVGNKSDMSGFHLVVGALQDQMKGLRDEVSKVTKTLDRNRQADLVARRSSNG